MILKADRIAHLLENPEQDDPLVIAPQPDIKKLKESGSASVDLRLGCWFAVLRQTRSSLLDIGQMGGEKTVTKDETSLTKMHYVRFGDRFILHTNCFVLGVTLEWIRLPNYLGGYVTSRSSWGRRGLIIATAVGVHPGFTGCLTLELSNVGEMPIALYPGTAISQFFIHKVDSGSDNVDRSRLIGKRKPTLGRIECDEFARKIAGIPSTSN